jgi:O-methyltransferase
MNTLIEILTDSSGAGCSSKSGDQQWDQKMATALAGHKGQTAATLYLDLMKRALSGWLHPEMDGQLWPERLAFRWLAKFLLPSNVRLFRRVGPEHRRSGTYWPSHAHTMIGMKRLDNLQFCIEDVIRRGVPGDLVETGVWRGGACILMRAVLEAHQIKDRKVWVADSFRGLPRPNKEKYPADAGDHHFIIPELAVSLDEVKRNFRLYGLLDGQVEFLEGWFKDTLPSAPFKQLAVARLDGDLYESTTDALVSLYPRLSPGGYLIIDDYHAVPACRQAAHDYRRRHGLTEKIEEIDGLGVFWQKCYAAPGR